MCLSCRIRKLGRKCNFSTYLADLRDGLIWIHLQYMPYVLPSTGRAEVLDQEAAAPGVHQNFRYGVIIAQFREPRTAGMKIACQIVSNRFILFHFLSAVTSPRF